MDNEVRMEIVNREGHLVWVPATSDKDFTNINNFIQWEQAF